MKRIALLGSTGSIGRQTIDVVQHSRDKLKVVAIAGGYNIDMLVEQVNVLQPEIVSVADDRVASKLRLNIDDRIRVVFGEDGLREVATNPSADMIVSAVVGSIGLKPTIAAIEAGKAVGIANKETLVAAGHIVMKKAAEHGVELLPIDSEHSAIFQCLQGQDRSAVEQLVLTSSGGAFRDKSRSELANVQPEEALQHPNWSMGAKITVDSATMMNKGLEVIEAHWLFDIAYADIDVLIHDESIIHSMVRFTDQAVLAQLGTPDMKVPIQYALTYPDRCVAKSEPLNLAHIGQLHFRPMDTERYPCLQMAYDAGNIGGSMPAVFNAANEMAVARFLQRDISFLDIETIILRTMDQHSPLTDPSLDEVLETDQWARTTASKVTT